MRTGDPELQLRVTRIEQLFDSLDPTPFRERDLDPRAEAYIVGWAREQPPDRRPALAVRLPGAGAEEAAVLQQAVATHFRNRAETTRGELRQVLRTGRTSLAIGLVFLAAATLGADRASELRYGILAESIVIGGWVAMWRPLETFLYDWWPIRAEARLFDRLASMTVRILPAEGS